MSRFFAMMRYNKQLLVVFICAIVAICVILGLGIFDIVQIIQVQSNTVKLSPAFFAINISMIALAGVALGLMVTMFIIMKIRGKRNESKKD